MVTRRFTLAPSRCFVIWQWRGRTAACAVCWLGSAESMCWSSMTGQWLHCRKPSAVTSGRSARIATRCARPSSLRNCQFPAGTSRSAIPLWPMASSTGWFTTLTVSRCVAIRCGRIVANRMRSGNTVGRQEDQSEGLEICLDLEAAIFLEDPAGAPGDICEGNGLHRSCGWRF